MKLLPTYWRIGYVLAFLVLSIALFSGTHVVFGHGGACVLELAMSDNPDPVIPEGDVVYHLTLRNVGTQNCTGGGVLLKNTFDPRVNYVSHAVIPADYPSLASPVISSLEHYVQFNFAVMQPGDIRDIDITVNVPTSFLCGGHLANHAEFFSDQTGWSDAATENTEVVCPTDENSRPIITLIGSSTVQIERGQAYTDPGATALDDEDGDITSLIAVTGLPVNTSSTGSSTIAYNVMDSRGAAAPEVTRSVIVIATSSVGGGGDDVSPTSTVSTSTAPVTPPVSDNPPTSDESHPIVTVGGGSGTFPPASPVVVAIGNDGGGSVSAGNSASGATVVTAQECNYLLEYIRFGFQNNPTEVRKLQAFLRDFEGFQNLQVTGFYDSITFEAVKAFQMRYSKDVLEPWGLLEPTGYVYITTKKKINEIYCSKQFPLTDAQVNEVENSRKILERLRDQGVPSQEFEGGLGGIPSSTGLASEMSTSTVTGTQLAIEEVPTSSLVFGTTWATSSESGRLSGSLAAIFAVAPWMWILLAILLALLFLLLWRMFALPKYERSKDIDTLENVEHSEGDLVDEAGLVPQEFIELQLDVDEPKLI